MIFRSYLSLLEGMWDMTPFGYHVSTDSIWQRNTRKSNSGFIFQTHFCLFSDLYVTAEITQTGWHGWDKRGFASMANLGLSEKQIEYPQN